MTRACDVCGRPYEAKRPNSRFCGGTCQKRHQRHPVERVIPMPEAVSALLETTRRELEAAGRLDTVLGQVALVLASSISSPLTTGSAAATLSRELRALMVEVLDDVPTGNALDELRARRDARLRMLREQNL